VRDWIASARHERAIVEGWTVVDMRRDWKRVFPTAGE
jgi:hypothetical protein